MANHRGPIPEFLTANYLQTVLRKSPALNSPNLIVDNLEVSAGSKVGDNYAGQIYRLTLEVRNAKEDKLSIIGKYNRPTVLLESMADQFNPFTIETYFFEKVLPEMDKKMLQYTPICYHVDPVNQIFLMNDLIQENYSLQPRNKTLGKEEAKLVMEALGNFHGSTYYVDLKNPKLKNECPSTLWNRDPPEPMKIMFRNSYKMVVKFLDFYDLPQKYSDIIRQSNTKLENEFCAVCEFQEDQLNFLLHGDCWKSNMMFRRTDGKVDSVKLLDFQILNFNCFANDLIYFLFSSVNADVIVNDLDELLELYYNTLISVAPDIPNLSFDRVKKEFASRYYFAFLLMLSFRPIHYSEVPPDFEDIMDGKEDPMGYGEVQTKLDFHKLFPFLDQQGLFDRF